MAKPYSHLPDRQHPDQSISQSLGHVIVNSVSAERTNFYGASIYFTLTNFVMHVLPVNL